MKTFFKWSGIGMAVAAATVLAVRWAQRLSQKVDRGLAHVEHITADARQAVEKTADALAHTEEAVHAARGTTANRR